MKIVVALQKLPLLLLLAACIPAQEDRDIPPELNCHYVQMRQAQTTRPHAIEITVAANAYRDYCWKLYGVMEAADQVDAAPLVVAPLLHNMVGPAFQEVLEASFNAGNAPDILSLSHTLVQPFAQAGYLYPLDECVRQYGEFDYIRAPVWRQVMWNDQIWGIPYELGVFLLYFNQQKLAELGWSASEIDDLPQKIEAGEFTLDDLLNVAQQAIQLGVVEPGFGFWPHLDEPWTLQLTYVAHGGRLFDEKTNKLVITQNALTAAYAFHQRMFQQGVTHLNLADPNHIFNDLVMWEDTVAHGRVLFWVGSNYNWPMLTLEYKDDLAPSVAPSEIFGYALFPPAHVDQPGQALWVQTGFYALSAPQVTNRAHQPLACALLAKTMTPTIAIRHSARSGLLSTLNAAEMAPYWQKYPFVKAQAQMWPHLITLPRQLPAYTDRYVPLLNKLLAQVQANQLSAEAASELAVIELRRQVHDGLIIE